MEETEKPRNLGHIMVDIETMGNQSGSALTSIGAVEFDLNTGEIGRTFYTKVNLQSCVDAGLKMNADTVLWWLRQNEEARNEIAVRKPDEVVPKLHEALDLFTQFVKDCGRETVCLWGNSARFDMGILSDAYGAIKKRIPWDFRLERCVRTLSAFAPEIKQSMPFEGTVHNAMDDCKHQIKYCVATWNAMRPLAGTPGTNYGHRLDVRGFLPGNLESLHSTDTTSENISEELNKLGIVDFKVSYNYIEKDSETK